MIVIGASKPLWLLDVDGVLNAIDPKQKHIRAWDGYEKRRVCLEGNSWYEVTWSPTLLLGIREMIEDGLVEVQWLTTWLEHANGDLREAFGLPVLAVANTREEYLAQTGWWKLATARRLAGDRPLIWTDDDLANDEAAHWVTERPWPTLAIAPSYRGGLQPTEFQAVYDFCVKHKESK